MPEEQKWQKIIEENNRVLAENTRMLKKIQRRMIFGQILTALKFLVIAVPLILAYFYLRPYYHDTKNLYQELMGGASSANGLNLLKGLEKAINLKK